MIEENIIEESIIEELDGTKETVHYQNESRVRLYHNTQNAGYPLHWHAAVEIIMPIRSGYQVTVRDVVYDLNEGDILFIAPGALHSISYPPEGERLLILYDPTLMNQLPEMRSFYSLVSPSLLIEASVQDEMHERIHEILVKILALEVDSHYFKDAQVYAELIRLTAILGNELVKDRSVRDVEPKHGDKLEDQMPSHLNIIFEACEYIEENSAQDLTLDQLANRAGFSKFYFSRLFKNLTNMSFLDYLHRCRIDEAERLLLDRDLSVTEVAHRVGFNSHSNFNRVFRKFNDCTPTEFRQLEPFGGYSGLLEPKHRNITH